MKRKIVIGIILTLLMIVVFNTSFVQASSLGDVISGGKEFINSGSSGALINEANLQDTSNSVVNILMMISFVVVAIVGVMLGIKYMMAGVDEKADVKKSLLIFVIGAIVIFGAFGIWKALVTFLNTSGL